MDLAKILGLIAATVIVAGIWCVIRIANSSSHPPK